MAYKDMNLVLYLLTTFVLYGLEMLGAILIEDISTVFEFASAFAVTALAFWFPAGYFLMAQTKYGKEPNPTQQRVAKLFIFVGVLNFLVGVFAGVLNVIGAGGGH
jgi:hypothetical protein